MSGSARTAYHGSTLRMVAVKVPALGAHRSHLGDAVALIIQNQQSLGKVRTLKVTNDRKAHSVRPHIIGPDQQGIRFDEPLGAMAPVLHSHSE